VNVRLIRNRLVETQAKPRRRFLRFSLRTRFVVVTVAGCWMGYSMNWIRQRHELLGADTIVTSQPGAAPMGIRLVGAEGFRSIGCLRERDVESFRSLFPEAEVRHFEGGID
jgi:hypothetical protein